MGFATEPKGTTEDMLRQHEWFVGVCSRVGLVLLLLLALGSPAAIAASEKPKPQPLWEAFPLNPTDKRLGSVYLPPAQGRPEVVKVTKAGETPAQASRTNVTVLALFAGAALLALALVGFASMRRFSVRNHRPSPVAAWQGTSWSNPSESARELRGPPPAQLRAAAVSVDRLAAPLHPDVPASAYRLRKLDRRRFRRSRVAPRGRRLQGSRVFADGFAGVARRMKQTVWNDRTAPVIVGTTVGIFAAFLLVYWIG